VRLPEPEHQARLTLWKQGLKDVEIGRVLGIPGKTIWSWRKAYRIPPNRPWKTRDSRDEYEDAPCFSVKKNLTPEQWAAEKIRLWEAVGGWR
jgi:uncharacterized protein YjcR